MACASAAPVAAKLMADVLGWDQETTENEVANYLKRVAADFKDDIQHRLPKPGPKNGKRVALVGGGPASLAVARDLAPLGYHCTVFDGDPMSTPASVSRGIAAYVMAELTAPRTNAGRAESTSSTPSAFTVGSDVAPSFALTTTSMSWPRTPPASLMSETASAVAARGPGAK